METSSELSWPIYDVNCQGNYKSKCHWHSGFVVNNNDGNFYRKYQKSMAESVLFFQSLNDKKLNDKPFSWI